MLIHDLGHVADPFRDIKHPQIADILQGGKCNRLVCLF